MRKKTYQEHAEAGTVRLDKMRVAKLEAVTTPPPPQKYLTTGGKRIYKKICQHIIQHNIMCEIDSFGISVLAHQFDLYQRMVEMVEEKEKRLPGSGYFQAFSNGVVQKSPEVQVMDKAIDQIFKYAKEFGLTVKSRDNIMAFSKAATDEDETVEEELNLD